MSTGRSAAKRESRKQRQMLAEQRRETQKELREEKDIEARQRRALKRSQAGMGDLLSQALGAKSLLGAGKASSGSEASGSGGNIQPTAGGYFITPEDTGSLFGPSLQSQDSQQDVMRTLRRRLT